MAYRPHVAAPPSRRSVVIQCSVLLTTDTEWTEICSLDEDVVTTKIVSQAAAPPSSGKSYKNPVAIVVSMNLMELFIVGYGDDETTSWSVVSACGQYIRLVLLSI